MATTRPSQGEKTSDGSFIKTRLGSLKKVIMQSRRKMTNALKQENSTVVRWLTNRYKLLSSKAKRITLKSGLFYVPHGLFS